MGPNGMIQTRSLPIVDVYDYLYKGSHRRLSPFCSSGRPNSRQTPSLIPVGLLMRWSTRKKKSAQRVCHWRVPFRVSRVQDLSMSIELAREVPHPLAHRNHMDTRVKES